MCAKVDAVTPGCPSTILTHDAAVGGRVGAQNVLGVLQQAAHNANAAAHCCCCATVQPKLLSACWLELGGGVSTRK